MAKQKDWFEKWEPKVWLADTALSQATAETKGVWVDLLNRMMESQTYQVTATLDGLCRLARCTRPEMERSLLEMLKLDVCDVEMSQKIVTCHTDVTLLGHGSVTLTCRRLQRKHKACENMRLRKQRSRARKACHADVTQTNSQSHSNTPIAPYPNVTPQEPPEPTPLPPLPDLDDLPTETPIRAAAATIVETTGWSNTATRKNLDEMENLLNMAGYRHNPTHAAAVVQQEIQKAKVPRGPCNKLAPTIAYAAAALAGKMGSKAAAALPPQPQPARNFKCNF